MSKRYRLTVEFKDQGVAEAAFRFFTGDDKPDNAEVKLEVVERVK